eukprot:13888705-Ditylum_brightwellii.AAC.1
MIRTNKNRPKIQDPTTMASDEHHLTPYLNETLPSLGLDPETYGPYVTGFDDDENDNDQDEDALNDLIELLRASSETHSDDEEAWEAFRKEIVKRQADHAKKLEQKK